MYIITEKSLPFMPHIWPSWWIGKQGPNKVNNTSWHNFRTVYTTVSYCLLRSRGFLRIYIGCIHACLLSSICQKCLYRFFLRSAFLLCDATAFLSHAWRCVVTHGLQKHSRHPSNSAESSLLPSLPSSSSSSSPPLLPSLSR